MAGARRGGDRYRGPLLIVSAKRPAVPPAGSAVALVNLVDCRPMTEADEPAAMLKRLPDQWAWVLTDARRVEPRPVRGQLGLFEAPIQLEDIGAKGGSCFALQVAGDSMTLAGIFDGDTAIVRRQETARSGNIVAVSVEGETTLKRYLVEGDTRLLVAENVGYPPATSAQRASWCTAGSWACCGRTDEDPAVLTVGRSRRGATTQFAREDAWSSFHHGVSSGDP